MLPRAHRLSRSAEFSHVVRRGSRAASPALVLHAVRRHDQEPVRVGFVVSRAVGDAVTRNRVKRRLRHLVADRLSELDAPCSVVVRANPPAAAASWEQLGQDLDRCIGTLERHQGRR